ncbi:MAG: transglycosylase SLT domain-containing protein [Terriglobales bacterium]
MKLARRRPSYRDAPPAAPILGGAALIGGGLLLYLYRDQLLGYAIQAAGYVGFYPDPSSRAAPYAQEITNAAQQTGVSPAIIAAIGDRETLWGLTTTPKGPGGTGDGGYGLGLMQIDSRYHSLPNWQDPQTNISAGASIFAGYYAQLQAAGVDAATLNQAAAAAYNAGVGAVLGAYNAGQSVDSVTTHGDYGADVLARAAKYAAGAA